MTVSVYLSEDVRDSVSKFAERLGDHPRDRASFSRALRQLVRIGLKHADALEMVK